MKKYHLFSVPVCWFIVALFSAAGVGTVVVAYQHYQLGVRYRGLLQQEQARLVAVLNQRSSYLAQIQQLKKQLPPVLSQQAWFTAIEASLVQQGLHLVQLKALASAPVRFQFEAMGDPQAFLRWLSVSFPALPCLRWASFDYQWVDDESLARYKGVVESCESLPSA